MQSFTYYSPTKVIFGKGAENKQLKRFSHSEAAGCCWSTAAAAW